MANIANDSHENQYQQTELQEKCRKSIQVIAHSVGKILTLSTNVEFRETCFEDLKVNSSREATAHITKLLWTTVKGALGVVPPPEVVSEIVSKEATHSASEPRSEELVNQDEEKPPNDNTSQARVEYLNFKTQQLTESKGKSAELDPKTFLTEWTQDRR